VKRWWVVALLGATVFLYWMGMYLYVPTLPTYARTKTESLTLVGVMVSMYGLWQAVIRLPLGISADALGWRKPFILVGLLLAGLGAWIMGTGAGIHELIVGRAITGLAAGAWVPLAVAFSSQFPPDQAVRASALLSFISSAGRMLATSLTGLLNQWGGYALAFYASVGVEAVAVVALLPAREARLAPQRPAWSPIGRLIVRRDVLLPSLLGAVCQYVNWATTFGFLPILVKQLGASDMVQSALASMNIGLGIACGLLVSGIIRRVSARLLVYVSFGLLTAGVVGLALAPSLAVAVETLAQQLGQLGLVNPDWNDQLVVVYLAQVFIGLGQGISYPVLMGLSIQNVPSQQRSTAMGVYQAVYAVGMFGGPSLGGWLSDNLGIPSMLWITGLVCLVSGLFLTRLLQDAQRPPV